LIRFSVLAYSIKKDGYVYANEVRETDKGYSGSCKNRVSRRVGN